MPYCTAPMVLFWMVLVLLLVPRLVRAMVLLPKPTPNRVVVVALPSRFRFLIVLLVADTLPVAVWPHTTALVVPVLVLASVRLRELVPAFEPSRVTYLAPFNTIRAVADEPVKVVVTPALGRIVSVLLRLASPLALKAMG